MVRLQPASQSGYKLLPTEDLSQAHGDSAAVPRAPAAADDGGDLEAAGTVQERRRASKKQRGGRGSRRQVHSAARADAGDKRCALRDQWNSAELDIARLFNQYDVDQSGELEASEFKKLLKDFNGGNEASDDEVKWMMKIADKDEDSKISKEELHFAMQAWKGYTHMQSEYGQLFEKYDVDKSNDLDVKELQNLLTELNEGKPVSEDEAKNVLKAADVTENQKVGRYELLGAIGVWYVSIGRMPTTDMMIGLAAIKGQMHDQLKLNIVQILGASILGAVCVYKGHEWQGETCDVPLAKTLQRYGINQLLQLLILIELYTLKRRQDMVSYCVCMIQVFTVICGFVVSIQGTYQVFTTNPHNCYPKLYNFSWWVFIFGCLITTSVIMISICCCVCGAAIVHARANDEDCQNMNEN